METQPHKMIKVLWHAFEFAPDAIVVVNEGGIIEMANTSAENLFGYAHSELVDQPVEVLIPARFRGHHAGHMAQYLRHPTVRSMGRDLELGGLRKDGSEFAADIQSH